MTVRRLAAAVSFTGLVLAIGPAALAGEWDLSAEVSAELRVFPYDAAFPGQKDAHLSPSAALEPELVYEFGGGDDRVVLKPFFRLDAHDNRRTHFDVREANWLHLGADWDLVVGVDKVFWGVTESRHLVDIVNQTDAVEDIDEEDKLGQPMLNLNLHRDWGTLGFFYLPRFRERTFPDDDARLRGPFPIDVNDADFESGLEEWHPDFVLRWAHTFDEWDIGLSQFYGTSREPRLIPVIGGDGQVDLNPRYDLINQTGLDVQYTEDAWLLKLEALTRDGNGDRYFAAVAGFEYTLFQIFDSDADLGLLAEYLHDGRDLDRSPFTAFDDDVFVGSRLTLNDTQDTAILAGAIIDRDNQATLLTIEAERRLGDDWKIELESRLSFNVPDDGRLAGIRDDDFFTLRLTRFF